MCKLYQQGDVSLPDVASWLMEWAFHPLAVDTMLRENLIDGATEEFKPILEIGIDYCCLIFRTVGV